MKKFVNHPSHYNQHPSGVECITIVQHFTFNIGNAIKYLWRAGLKPSVFVGADASATEDLRKAAKYIEFEIVRLTSVPKSPCASRRPYDPCSTCGAGPNDLCMQIGDGAK